MGLGLDLFSSSSSSTTNNYEQTTTTTKSHGVRGGESGSVAFGELGGFGNNVEVLDGDAINSAFDFAEESQAYLNDSFTSVVGLTEDAYDFAYDVNVFASEQVDEMGNKNLASQRILADAINTGNAQALTQGASSYIAPAMMVIGVVSVAYIIFK